VQREGNGGGGVRDMPGIGRGKTGLGWVCIGGLGFGGRWGVGFFGVVAVFWESGAIGFLRNCTHRKMQRVEGRRGEPRMDGFFFDGFARGTRRTRRREGFEQKGAKDAKEEREIFGGVIPEVCSLYCLMQTFIP
jgi:hypothetical protein